MRDRLVAGLVLFWLCGLGQAANLSINPVRITLDSSRSIAALHLSNRGNQPVVMQAAVREWAVEDGEDHYTETDALIVTPPVFTVAPGKEQVVRVGLRRPAPNNIEQSFRVFLEQAPAIPAGAEQPTPAPTGIQVTLRIGIPVFVSPDAPVTREVEWRARRLDDDKLRLEAVNHGNVHVQVQRLSLLGPDGEALVQNEAMTYLLPGSRRYWVLDLPPAAAPPYRIKAWTKAGELEAEIKADKS